jgi:HK97 family phage major capsid protein
VPVYNASISRDASNDPLVPQPVSDQIIQELPSKSVMLSRAAQMSMGTKTQRLPVLDVLPLAYFVGGDTGMKQTSSQDWKGLDLVAEEIATIVPVPKAYLDDAQVPIWDQVRPRLVEAVGALIDGACLFGVSKPTTWGIDIYTGALNAGNNVIKGAGTTDIAQNIALMGEKVAQDGYSINGFASRPGFQWNLVALRSAGSEKLPIYQPDLTGRPGGVLYGYPLSEATNEGWKSSDAELIAGDWTKAIVGIRQDITYDIFDQGVISDASGAVVLNLMQQDAVAMRVVMRLAYQVANPVTRLNATGSTRFAFGVVQATTAAS